jgi:hypothetical protein
MPLFLKENRSILYMHVPKTGGLAVDTFFRDNEFQVEFFDGGGPRSFNKYRRCAPQHMHAEQILSLLRLHSIDYIFMTVRDPLARVISEYKMYARAVVDAPPLSEWVDRLFRRYLADNYVAENHIRPQAEFWLPTCEIFRQEDGHGSALTLRIEQKLGIELKHPTIGTHNMDKGTSIDPAEIQKIAPIVRQFYHRDYVMFGY